MAMAHSDEAASAMATSSSSLGSSSSASSCTPMSPSTTRRRRSLLPESPVTHIMASPARVPLDAPPDFIANHHRRTSSSASSPLLEHAASFRRILTRDAGDAPRRSSKTLRDAGSDVEGQASTPAAESRDESQVRSAPPSPSMKWLKRRSANASAPLTLGSDTEHSGASSNSKNARTRLDSIGNLISGGKRRSSLVPQSHDSESSQSQVSSRQASQSSTTPAAPIPLRVQSMRRDHSESSSRVPSPSHQTGYASSDSQYSVSSTNRSPRDILANTRPGPDPQIPSQQYTAPVTVDQDDDPSIQRAALVASPEPQRHSIDSSISSVYPSTPSEEGIANGSELDNVNTPVQMRHQVELPSAVIEDVDVATPLAPVFPEDVRDEVTTPIVQVTVNLEPSLIPLPQDSPDSNQDDPKVDYDEEEAVPEESRTQAVVDTNLLSAAEATSVPMFSPGTAELLVGRGTSAREARPREYQSFTVASDAAMEKPNPLEVLQVQPLRNRSDKVRALVDHFDANTQKVQPEAQTTPEQPEVNPQVSVHTSSDLALPGSLQIGDCSTSQMSHQVPSIELSAHPQPSPSASETASKLADVYGAYIAPSPALVPINDAEVIPIAEVASVDVPTSGLPHPEISVSTGSDYRGHSRQAASEQVDDTIEEPEPASARSAAVMDELDAMLGQAMNDIQNMSLPSRPASKIMESVQYDSPESNLIQLAHDLGDVSIGTESTVTRAESVVEEPPSLAVRNVADEEEQVVMPSNAGSDVGAPRSMSPTNIQDENLPLLEDSPPVSPPFHTATSSTSINNIRRQYFEPNLTSPTLSSLSSSSPVARKTPRPAARSSSALLLQSQWVAQQQARQDAEAKLRKSRKLPEAMQSEDVKKLRSSGERAVGYAKKINALSKEESGLDIWILKTRELRNKQVNREPLRNRVNQTSPIASPYRNSISRASTSSTLYRNMLSTNGHPREISTASAMTFPIRSDATRAIEIHHEPAPSNLMQPTHLPYPGVYNFNNTSTGSASSSVGVRASGSVQFVGSVPSTRTNTLTTSPQTTTTPPQTTTTMGKGFLTTLGRRSSRRVVGPKPTVQPFSNDSMTVHENVFESDSRDFRGTALKGPRPPNMMTSTNNTLLPLPPPPVSEVVVVESGVNSSLFEEQLNKIEDILPQASREVLGQFLIQEKGDDLAAIGAYLEAERQGKM